VLNIVRRLFAVSVLQALGGIVTGILAARALQPEGRGELAAIAAPLGIAPFVVAFGLTTYATRAAARGDRLGPLVGTLGIASVAIGLVMIAPGLWLAHVLAEGRQHVELLIGVGMVLLPVSLLAGILGNVAMGLGEWSWITRQRMIPVIGSLIAYVVLYALNALTVVSAGIVLIATGALTIVPVLPVLARAGRLSLDGSLAKNAFTWGARVTPITFSQLLNHRLDQLIMVPLVSASELGLYAVAVTVSGVAGMLSSSISTVLLPRLVSAGSDADVGRAVRTGLVAVVLIGIPTAAVSPVAVPLLFGSGFSPAYPLILVLLVATVPLAGVAFFASAYTAHDKLGVASLSEIVALGVTVVGLVLLLPSLGAMGAALVSLVAYSVNFAWLVAVAPGDFGGRMRDYCLPRRADLSDIAERLLSALRHRGPRRTA
jgi:O-antigen/teichoic acid export membrane protein